MQDGVHLLELGLMTALLQFRARGRHDDRPKSGSRYAQPACRGNQPGRREWPLRRTPSVASQPIRQIGVTLLPCMAIFAATRDFAL